MLLIYLMHKKWLSPLSHTMYTEIRLDGTMRHSRLLLTGWRHYNAFCVSTVKTRRHRSRRRLHTVLTVRERRQLRCRLDGTIAPSARVPSTLDGTGIDSARVPSWRYCSQCGYEIMFGYVQKFKWVGWIRWAELIGWSTCDWLKVVTWRCLLISGLTFKLPTRRRIRMCKWI